MNHDTKARGRRRRGLPGRKSIASALCIGLVALFVPASLSMAQAVAGPARIEYYGEIACGHCDTFAENLLPAAERASGVKVELELVDIMSVEGFRKCEARLAGLGRAFRVFPVLVIGESVYQGNAAIEANLLPELEYFAAHRSYRAGRPEAGPEAGHAEAGRMEAGQARAGQGALDGSSGGPGMLLGGEGTWPALTILAAGLVDGINPCAFTTLLFFMSYLGLRGGGKRRALVAGLSFAAGVYLSYLLIGMGVFNALRAGGALRQARLVLRIVVGAMALVFAVLSARDIVLIRKGKRDGLGLSLPAPLRGRVNAAIRAGVSSPLFFGGVFVAGVVVALLELACTGQVYFPAIAFMVQSGGSLYGYGSLFLYNAAFITPLLLVLLLVLLGLRLEAVRSFFLRHLVAARAVQALVVLALGILVWLL